MTNTRRITVSVTGGCIAIAIVLAATLVLSGCLTQPKHKSRPTIHQVNSHLDKLYDQYLHGDIHQAKQSMEDAISILNNSDLHLPPRMRTFDLFLSYCRLYGIERRSGHKKQAESYLRNARKWYFQEMVISGTPVAKATKISHAFTGDKCMAVINHKDGVAAQTLVTPGEEKGSGVVSGVKEKNKP